MGALEALVCTLAIVGVFAIAALLVHAVPEAYYWLRYKRPRPTVQELEHTYRLEQSPLETKEQKAKVTVLEAHNTRLNQQLDETLKKLVQRAGSA